MALVRAGLLASPVTATLKRPELPERFIPRGLVRACSRAPVVSCLGSYSSRSFPTGEAAVAAPSTSSEVPKGGLSYAQKSSVDGSAGATTIVPTAGSTEATIERVSERDSLLLPCFGSFWALANLITYVLSLKS